MWTVQVVTRKTSGERVIVERDYYDVRDALIVAEIERDNAVKRAETMDGVAATYLPDLDREEYVVEYHGDRAVVHTTICVRNAEHSKIALR